MTVQEYMDLLEPAGEKIELIGGAVIHPEPGNYLHEISKSNVLHLLVSWLSRNPGGRVFCYATFQLNEANSSPTRILHARLRHLRRHLN
jgi:hypothetical protein